MVSFSRESRKPIRNLLPPTCYMRMLIAFFEGCLFELSSTTFGQPLSVGVVGGASLTQDFQNQRVGNLIAYSTPKRWIAGGMVEVRLPLHLSIEVDGLYHELEFTQAFIEPNGILNSVSPAPVVTREFPVMAKYRFSLPMVKPFVEAGPSFRSSGNLNGSLPSDHGFMVGVGVEAHAWKLRFAPQVRYLHWARDHVTVLSPSTVPVQADEFMAV